MATQVLNYFLQTVEDTEIRSVLDYAHQLSENHVQRIIEFFKDENIPIPQGFTDEDVNLNAPRLFTDDFMQIYIQYMGAMGLSIYRQNFIIFLIFILCGAVLALHGWLTGEKSLRKVF